MKDKQCKHVSKYLIKFIYLLRKLFICFNRFRKIHQRRKQVNKCIITEFFQNGIFLIVSFYQLHYARLQARSLVKCFKQSVDANRLSCTIGGNREMDQLYTTSQVSNIPRKTKFSHII